ncbi:hypothetical protein RintRC_1083 [Richelia intracellularis]|nr:hypothetical protein RintRC_1083 [Richelia intracellularis]
MSASTVVVGAVDTGLLVGEGDVSPGVLVLVVVGEGDVSPVLFVLG